MPYCSLPPVHLVGLSAHAPVEFLPKNTSIPIQPMNQGITAAFKAYYLCSMLSQQVQETAGEDQPSAWAFWHSCTVKTTVDNNAEAWSVLQPTTVNSAQRKLWPQHVPAGMPAPDSLPLLCHSTVVLASHVGLGDVAEADVSFLLQAY